MKYIFKNYVVFEYIPDAKFEKVVQHQISYCVPAFDFCKMVSEDYKLLSQFFDVVYRHIQGENVELKDVIIS